MLFAIVSVFVGVFLVARLALDLASPDGPRLGGNVGDGNQADYTRWPFGALLAPININPRFIEAAESDDQTPTASNGDLSPAPTALIPAPTVITTPSPPLVTATPSATPTATQARGIAREPSPSPTHTPLPQRAPTLPPTSTSTSVANTPTPAPPTATPATSPGDQRPPTAPSSPTRTPTTAPPAPTTAPPAPTTAPPAPTTAPPTRTQTPVPPTSTATPGPSPTPSPTLTPTPPSVGFVDVTVVASEEQGQASLVVRLTNDYHLPVTVSYRVLTADSTATRDSDYTLSDGSLTFNPRTSSGAGETEKRITIRLLSDSLNEDSERVTVRLFDASAGGSGAGISPDIARLSITDDTAPPTVHFVGTERTVAESSDSVAFTVELSQISALPVAVPYMVEGTASPGSVSLGTGDHDLRTGVVIIPAGASSARVRFAIINDRIDEDNEQILIRLGTPINAELVSPSEYRVTITDDDTAGVQIGQKAFALLEGASDTYTVTLASEPTGVVTVSLVPDAQTRVSQTALTFTPLNWSRPQTVTLTAYDDFLDESNLHAGLVEHMVTSADPRYNRIDLLASLAINVQITDNDTAGVIVGARTPLTVNESPIPLIEHTATYSIALKSQPTAPVTLTIMPDDQVTVSPTTLVFDESNWRGPLLVTVTAVDDDFDEPALHDGLITHSVTSTDSLYNSLPAAERPADVNVQVTDNDTAGILLSPGQLSLSEDPLAADHVGTYTVTLTSRPTATVTVNIAVTNTEQLSVAPATLTFAADENSWRTPQTVTVTAGQDLIDEGPDNVPHVRLISHKASSGDGNYNLPTGPTQIVAITDDDTAGIVISSGAAAVAEGGTTTYTVRLNTKPVGSVTLALTNAPAGQITSAPASLLFTQADWQTPKAVTVSASENPIIDGNRPVTITHSVSGSGDPVYATLAATDLSLTVLDNDLASLTFTAPAGIIEGQSGSYSFALTSKPAAEVTVNLFLPPGVQVNQPAVIFTPETWDQARSVTVTITDDPGVTGDRLATIGHTFASADSAFNGAGPFGYTLTVIENDAAGLETVPGSASLTLGEAAGLTTGSFTVALTSQPTAAVTVTLSPDDQQLVSPGELVFTTDNYTQPQTIVVNAVDDPIAEATPHAGTIALSSASIDPLYNRAWPGYIVRITDNDVAQIEVTAPADPITTEDGVTTTFQIRLTSQPTSTVTITVETSDLSEGTVSVDAPWALPLVFDQSNWSFPVTVTVTGQNDDDDDGQQPYQVLIGNATSLDPAYSGKAPTLASIELRNNDNEPALASISDALPRIEPASEKAPVQFSVTLQRAPLVTTTVGFATYDLTALNGEDYEAATGVVTFTPGISSALIDVQIYGDRLFEPQELFGVRLTSFTAADGSVAPGDTDAIGTIDNYATAALRFELPEILVAESAGAVPVTVRLERARTSNVSVEYSTIAPGAGAGTATAPEDFVAKSGILVFTPGQVTQTINLTINNDDQPEALYETINLALYNPSGTLLGIPTEATVTIIDDDGTPPTESRLFMTTGGPGSQPGDGYYYTGDITHGYSYAIIGLPCSWPLTQPLTFELWSPAMHGSGSNDLAGTDLARGATAFELYDLGPGWMGGSLTPAANLSGTTTAPYGLTDLDEDWQFFDMIDPPTPCGRYVLRSESSGDDENYWAVRAGFADDNDLSTPLKTTVPGSNERLSVATLQTTVKHQTANTTTTAWFYVAPGTSTLRLRSFDLGGDQGGAVTDADARVRFYGPGQSYDPTGATGGVPGSATVASWGETSLSKPQPGWWRAVVFTTIAPNGYILEAEGDGAALPMQYEQPLAPALNLSLTPSQPAAVPGEQLSLTLTYQSHGQATGANTTLTLRLPNHLAFDGDPCGSGPAGCSWSADDTLRLEPGNLAPGASGSHSLNVVVTADARGKAAVSLGATFSDAVGNSYRSSTGAVISVP